MAPSRIRVLIIGAGLVGSGAPFYYLCLVLTVLALRRNWRAA